MIEPVELDKAAIFLSYDYARDWAADYITGFPGWRVVAMPNSANAYVIELVAGSKRYYSSLDANKASASVNE